MAKLCTLQFKGTIYNKGNRAIFLNDEDVKNESNKIWASLTHFHKQLKTFAMW